MTPPASAAAGGVTPNAPGALDEPVVQGATWKRFVNAPPGQYYLLLDNSAAAIREIAQSHGATRVRVFGSVARGEQRSSSDLDLLVDLAPRRSLLDLIAIKQDVEDLLGLPVDVVTESSLSPYIREAVLKDAVAL